MNWSTATETNNRGFEVERREGSGQSVVGNWEKIGFVNGSGTNIQSTSYTFTDDNVSSGNYIYRLKQINFDGIYKYSKQIEVNVNVPSKFSLSQNYPNPFNPTTRIIYQIAEAGNVKIKVYDVSGREIATLVNKYKLPGKYTVTFDASKLASGVYFYRLESGKFFQTKKMVLLR